MSNHRRANELRGWHMVLAPFATMALLAAVAQAQTTAPAPPSLSSEELHRAIEQRREELKSSEERQKSIEADVAKLNADRERLNTRLIEAGAAVQRSEAELTRIEARLTELEAQEKLVRGSLNQSHGRIAKLLAALQRMGRNPPPVMITRREDALEMVRSAMLLSAAFPELKSQADEISGKLNDLVRVMTETRTERERLKAETDRQTEMKTRLAGLIETKRQSVVEREAELVQVRAAATEIKKNVGDLNELIAKLDEAVRKNTGLGAYDRETKSSPSATASAGSAPTPPDPAELAAVPSAAAPPAPTAAIPAPAAGPVEAPPTKPTTVAALAPPPRAPTEAPAKTVELAPVGASLVPGSPGRIKPAIAFADAHARLPSPAQGKRVISFGDKTPSGAQSKGIVIETRTGAQVTAPCDGWVVYAGEFRSYGQLLIINAGGGYHVLIAGMSQIDVQLGQFVLAAEPVGTMSGPSRPVQGGAKPAAPVLYIEFRKDGQPIDPEPWWAKGNEKVQG